jgi:hypothetical protein
MSIHGCNPQKKIEKATQLVLMNEDARNYIFSKVAKVNPCVNDTTIINTKDTLYSDIIGVITDTIRKQDTVYISDTVIKRVTRQVDKFNYVVDRRMLNSQQDSTDKYRKLYNKECMNFSEKNYEARKWKLYFFVLWILILCFASVSIYIKFYTKRFI